MVTWLLITGAALAQTSQFTLTITNNSAATWEAGVVAVLDEGASPNTLLDNGPTPTQASAQYHTYTYAHGTCDPNGEDDGDAALLISRWGLVEGVDAWIVGPLAPAASETLTIAAQPGEVLSFTAKVVGSADDNVMMHVPGDVDDQSIDLFSGTTALTSLSFDIGGYDVNDCSDKCPPTPGCNVTYGNGTTGGGAGGSQPPDAGGCDDLDWYADTDADGFGDPLDVVIQCEPPTGYVAIATDCNDGEALAHPGRPETPYDGIDNDCDPGTPDDDLDGDGLAFDADCDDSNAAVGAATDWYADLDGDGFGDPAAVTTACTAPADHSADGTDCDDSDALVSPVGTEVCNGVDDDCEGTVDQDAIDERASYADADGDGFGDASVSTQGCAIPDGFVDDATDCDDTDESVFPGAIEQCNGIDDNCSGEADEGVVDTDWYPDADADGYGNPAGPILTDCIAPDGHVSAGTDCDDARDDVFPGAAESCDGIDNNCDGDTDEDACDTADTGDFDPTSAHNDRELVAYQPADTGGAGAGCACSSSTGPGGALAFGLPLLLLARRRSRSPR